MTNHWIEGGWGYQASSIDELTRLVSRIGTLQIGERFVWRGATNARWTIQSSLQRRLKEAPEHFDPKPRPYNGTSPIRRAEKRLLAAAREWGLGFEGGTYLSDLQMLASLQHHGVPTRLIDVTTDPMTALWFACQRASDGRDATGVLFAFNVTRLETVNTMPAPARTLEALSDPLGWSLTEALSGSRSRRLPYLLEPTVRDARMIAQQGSFLLGTEPDEPEVAGVEAFVLSPRSGPPGEKLGKLAQPADRGKGRPAYVDFCAILIPPNLKTRMLQHLESTYTKRFRTMYPDMAGFADAVLNQRMALPTPPTSGPGLMDDIKKVRARETRSALSRAGLGGLL